MGIELVEGFCRGWLQQPNISMLFLASGSSRLIDSRPFQSLVFLRLDSRAERYDREAFNVGSAS